MCFRSVSPKSSRKASFSSAIAAAEREGIEEFDVVVAVDARNEDDDEDAAENDEVEGVEEEEEADVDDSIGDATVEPGPNAFSEPRLADGVSDAILLQRRRN